MVKDNCTLIFDRVIEYDDGRSWGDKEDQYSGLSRYEVGQHSIPRKLAELLLNLEGVRVEGCERTYFSHSMPRIPHIYTLGELQTRQRIVHAISTKGLPADLGPISFQKIDDEPRIIDAYVSAVCDTEPNYWSGEDVDYLDRLRERVSQILEERRRNNDKKSEKLVSQNQPLKENRFIEKLKFQETWWPYQGLALVCSLNPDTVFGGCSIDMEIAEDIFVGKTYLDGDVMKCTGNNTFWLQCNFSDYTKSIIDFNEIYLFPQKQHSISNNSDAVQARNDTLSFAISAFKRLLELWRTRANPNERLTPKEFIGWVVSKGHMIEWLGWAMGEELYYLEDATVSDLINVGLIKEPNNENKIRDLAHSGFAFLYNKRKSQPTIDEVWDYVSTTHVEGFPVLSKRREKPNIYEEFEYCLEKDDSKIVTENRFKDNCRNYFPYIRKKV